MSAVFQARAFVPVLTVYMCVVGAQQEIEPQQHFHVKCKAQKHIVRPHTTHTKNTVAAKNAAAHISLVIGMPMFPLFLRRPWDIKSTPSRRGTLYIIETKRV